MAVTRLSGGLTPGDGADPRTFPTIWNATADDIEAAEANITTLQSDLDTAEADIVDIKDGDYSKVPTGGSAGQVLVKDSATDFDADWVHPRFLVKPRVNSYIGTAFGGGLSGFNLPVNRLILIPIIVRQPVSVNQIGLQVSTAEASSSIRLGLYENVDGEIGGLIVDAGTVDSSTTGNKTITIDETLQPGLVWGAAVFQNSTSTLQVLHGFDSGIVKVFGTADPVKSTQVVAAYEDGVSGVLPSTVTPVFDSRRSANIGLRVSAVL